MEPKRITTKELKRRLDSGERLVILDDRGQEAWEKSDLQIPSSLRVPADQVDRFVDRIPANRPVITFCS
jgi:hypothetical protein